MYRSILISYSQKPDNCADHQTTMERTCLIIKRLTNPFCGDVQAVEKDLFWTRFGDLLG